MSQWIDMLKAINEELDYLKDIERKLIKNSTSALALQAARRKNTLLMGTLCKYEQELKTEHTYVKTEYSVARAKEHEKKREMYSLFLKEFHELKGQLFLQIAKYERN